jgi:transposase
MPRTHGYSLKGSRCYGSRNWGAGGRTNVIGALLEHSLLTVSLFDGTINSATFESWLEQDLLPKLPATSVIIMDNAAFHKKATTQKMIALAGHTLEFLPPYSPDLNPIENKWAQAKAIRRKYLCSISELFQTYCV